VTILDTNVLSALMRRVPDAVVVSWLDQQPPASVWTTAINVLEIRYGLAILPAGKRRTSLIQTFEILITRVIDNRVAPLDLAAAERAAQLMAARHRAGRPGDLRDTLVGAIALAHRATLATRNTRHFEDLSVWLVNPWQP
jgi:predicted nucleic acid-binding protein